MTMSSKHIHGPAAEAIGVADRALADAALPTYTALAEQRAQLLEALRNLVEAVEDSDRDSLMELLAAHEALAAAGVTS